jgi:hypothetical protein
MNKSSGKSAPPDPTSRAIHSQRLESEAKKFFRPKPLLYPRRRW